MENKEIKELEYNARSHLSHIMVEIADLKKHIEHDRKSNALNAVGYVESGLTRLEDCIHDYLRLAENCPDKSLTKIFKP